MHAAISPDPSLPPFLALAPVCWQTAATASVGDGAAAEMGGESQSSPFVTNTIGPFLGVSVSD